MLHLKFHSIRKLSGEGLGSCSIEELQEIEQKLERSIRSVRARKVRIINNKPIETQNILIFDIRTFKVY